MNAPIINSQCPTPVPHPVSGRARYYQVFERAYEEDWEGELYLRWDRRVAVFETIEAAGAYARERNDLQQPVSPSAARLYTWDTLDYQVSPLCLRPERYEALKAALDPA